VGSKFGESTLLHKHRKNFQTTYWRYTKVILIC